MPLYQLFQVDLRAFQPQQNVYMEGAHNGWNDKFEPNPATGRIWRATVGWSALYHSGRHGLNAAKCLSGRSSDYSNDEPDCTGCRGQNSAILSGRWANQGQASG